MEFGGWRCSEKSEWPNTALGKNEPLNVQQRRQKINAAKLAKKKKKVLELKTEEDIHNVLENIEEEEYDQRTYLNVIEKSAKSSKTNSDSEDDSDSDEEEQEEQNNNKRKLTVDETKGALSAERDIQG